MGVSFVLLLTVSRPVGLVGVAAGVGDSGPAMLWSMAITDGAWASGPKL